MKIEIPTECPCCSYPLELVNDQLFCRNLACDAQLGKKIEHFAKVLQIKGFGPQTVAKLNLSDITELFYLDRDTCIKALGSTKVVDKLLDEIERCKSAPLNTVLASMSIPLIGETASAKIASVVSNISEINPETCKLAGLGAKATENLMLWLTTDYPELKEFLPFSFSSSNKPAGRTVCITGKLTSYKTKSEATAVLEAAGFRVVESVTKSLAILVDETDKTSTKRKKAEEYGIMIVANLNQFLKDI